MSEKETKTPKLTAYFNGTRKPKPQPKVPRPKGYRELPLKWWKYSGLEPY